MYRFSSHILPPTTHMASRPKMPLSLTTWCIFWQTMVHPVRQVMNLSLEGRWRNTSRWSYSNTLEWAAKVEGILQTVIYLNTCRLSCTPLLLFVSYRSKDTSCGPSSRRRPVHLAESEGKLQVRQNENPCPVVIVNGSGRIANMLADIYEKMEQAFPR